MNSIPSGTYYVGVSGGGLARVFETKSEAVYGSLPDWIRVYTKDTEGGGFEVRLEHKHLVNKDRCLMSFGSSYNKHEAMRDSTVLHKIMQLSDVTVHRCLPSWCS